MSVSLMTAAFKAQLPDVEIIVSGEPHTIKASTAKFVLLALADHANDEGRGAYPSLDRLAKKTSLSRRTVQRALDALIKLNIIKCVGASEYGTDDYTISKAILNNPLYVERGDDSGTQAGDSSTEGDDSSTKSFVPESPESSLIQPSIKTSINDNLSNSSSKKVPESIEWMIAAGVSSEKIADLTAKERHSKEITDCYEKEMGYNNLPWGKLERLKKFLMTKTPDEIKQFAIWSKGKFSAFTPAKARLYPDMVIDLFPQAFLTEVKPPSMYDILAKQIEEERNGSSEIRS